MPLVSPEPSKETSFVKSHLYHYDVCICHTAVCFVPCCCWSKLTSGSPEWYRLVPNASPWHLLYQKALSAIGTLISSFATSEVVSQGSVSSAWGTQLSWKSNPKTLGSIPWRGKVRNSFSVPPSELLCTLARAWPPFVCTACIQICEYVKDPTSILSYNSSRTQILHTLGYKPPKRPKEKEEKKRFL